MCAGMQRWRHGLGQIGGNVVPRDRNARLRQSILDCFHAGNCTSDPSDLPVKPNIEPGKDLEWTARMNLQTNRRAAGTKQMKTQFSFGKNGIEVAVPEGFRCQIIRSRSAAALKDEVAALDAALDHPIGCEPLAALAAGKRTAAISVCDITRPAPNRITLPPLLKRMHGAGIPKEGVTILIATGLHRAATSEELDIILG